MNPRQVPDLNGLFAVAVAVAVADDIAVAADGGPGQVGVGGPRR
ncbi:hypothetical protein AB0E08_33215 [Streptomyces sp. NPDC048281]